MTRQGGLTELRKQSVVLKMIGIGWYIAFCLGAGLGGGLLLDNHLDTFPIFALVCLTLGLFVSFYGIYRMIAPLLKENQNNAIKKEDKE